MSACEFHPLAEAEIDEAVAHYEAIESGKGIELLAQVEAAVERICQFPESAPVTCDPLRSMLVQPATRWHFALHYSVTRAGIRILALAHQKRQPFYWLERR